MIALDKIERNIRTALLINQNKTPGQIRDRFHVGFQSRFLTSISSWLGPGAKSLANWETACLRARIAPVKITRPVFICGLARSGSTLLLEYMASHQQAATHRYSDFPFVYTPYFWNSFLNKIPRQNTTPVERAHLDGMKITFDSPEAMEEPLWRLFFKHAHNAEFSHVLNMDSDFPHFEKFFTEHIKKLLLTRSRSRYISKNNYNISRLQYLIKIFPDCRFIIPVRNPETHVFSLIKQHHLFNSGLYKNQAGRKHLRHAGHFEFGPDRVLINMGDHDWYNCIHEYWKRDQELKPWAMYWADIYNNVLNTVHSSSALNKACLFVRFEDLCEHPVETLSGISRHCDLEGWEEACKIFSKKIKYPDYYTFSLTNRQKYTVKKETETVARQFGYYPTDKPAIVR